ncbi:MAG: hypothetical protein ACAH88_11740 [Roseimicrobium sp.]
MERQARAGGDGLGGIRRGFAQRGRINILYASGIAMSGTKTQAQGNLIWIRKHAPVFISIRLEFPLKEIDVTPLELVP